jgi:hypothetical protein
MLVFSNYVYEHLGGLPSQGKEFHKAVSAITLQRKTFILFKQDLFVPPEYTDFVVVCQI